MSSNNRCTRARNQERDNAEEEYDHTSSSSSANAARRTAEEDANALRLEQEDADALIAIQVAQEEADAIDAARFAQEEADAIQLAQEEADAADATRLEQEEAASARELELQRRRNIIRETGAQGQFPPSILPLRNPSNNPLNPITSTTASTPVGVDRQPGIINRIDQVTKGNAFLSKRNIQSKINSASTILYQQPEIAELNLSEAQLYLALDLMMSDPTVAAVKTAHSSNVNVMTNKAPPSFCGVITSAEVDKLVRYSNLLGTEIVNLRSIVDKAAIYITEMHLSARGYLCGFNKPTDYERWLDWDHR
jgi:hypothetical protein